MLDRFELLLLDLNGTFMFNQDRFGPEEGYFETYVGCGGTRLSAQEVVMMVNELVSLLESIGADPMRFDSFPGVSELLLTLNGTREWPDSELKLVEQVVALHELGTIPSEYAETVLRLRGMKPNGTKSCAKG